MDNPKARWIFALLCRCPHCEKLTNLLEDIEFWSDHPIDLGESDTERTKNMEVICPKCDKEFLADCEYL